MKHGLGGSGGRFIDILLFFDGFVLLFEAWNR